MKKLLSLLLVLSLLCSLLTGLTVYADDTAVAEGVAGETVTEGVTGGETLPEEPSTEEDDEETIVYGDGFIYDKETCLLTITGSGEMDDFSWWNDIYAPWSGYAKEAKKVIISDGITSIGDYAFEDFIALKEAVIPNSVKRLGMHSFSGSALSELNIPASVEVIDDMPFVNCDYITRYKVDADNSNYCSVDGVLFSKDKSVLIAYPLAKVEEGWTYTIPETVTEVKGYAFSRANNLNCVNFGSNVKGIGDECFFNCVNLTTVNFNEGLEFIGGGAFQHCHGIEIISLPSTITKIRPLAFYDTAYYNNLENWESGMLYVGQCLLTGEYCISNEYWEAEETRFVEGAISIKEGTNLIAGSAFSWFNWDPAITSVSFPSSLKYINEYAFSFCDDLTEIKLKSNVEWIDDGAFSYCENLADVVLGDNIKQIGLDAFYETSYIANENHYVDGLLYNNKYLLGYKGTLPTTIEIEDGITLIADNALTNGGTYSFQNFSVKLPESLKYIGKETFVNTKTNTIKIPESVESIGDYAIGFKKTYNYSTEEYDYIPLGDNLIQGYADTAAQKYAQKYNIEFEDLSAPQTVTFGCFTCTVENEALVITGFDWDDSYSPIVEIPDYYYGTPIVKIASGAFYDCSGISSITIPDSILIEANAFANCDNVIFYVTCSSSAHTYAQNNGLNFVAECIFSDNYDGIINTCANCGKTECEILGHDISGKNCIRDGCTYIENDNLGGGGNIDIGGVVIPGGGNINTTYTEGRFTYTVNEGTASITDYDDTDAPSYLIIPSLLGGYTVTHIDDNAFSGCSNLKEVTVAKSITTIRDNAFCDCVNLEKIVIPSSVTYISTSAFQMCINLVVYAPYDSYARQYCNRTHIDFVIQCETHSWIDATCIAPQTCEYCDKTVGTELGHTGGNATCETRAICLRCNLPYGEVNGHNMAGPTCTEPAKCMEENCGYVSAPALGHTGGKATCTQRATCERCNQEYGSTSHSFSAPCDESCNECGAKVATTAAHSYSNSCDKTCNKCGKTRTTSHSYKNKITKATLSKNGKKQSECTVCGYISSKSSAIYRPYSFKLSTTSYTYNGKAKKPTVSVKDSAGKTIASSNYTVTYASGRKNVGTYKVTIKFKGNYKGTKNLTFKVNPVATTVSKVKAAKKSLKVYVSRKSKQVTGYQIYYSTSKSFKSYKSKNITNYKTTSITLKGLSAKKTYYVKVRTYKTVKGVKYYSDWSTVKTKKTK